MLYTKALCLVAIALASAAGSGVASAADRSLYDPADERAHETLKTWGALATTLIESGRPSGEALSFDRSAWGASSPLFSPLSLALSITRTANGGPVVIGDCREIDDGVAVSVTLSDASAAQLRTLLSTGALLLDAKEDELLFAAAVTAYLINGDSTTLTTVDGTLVAFAGLPATPVDTRSDPGIPATKVSDATLASAAEVGALAVEFLRSVPYTSEGDALILGGPSTADLLAAKMNSALQGHPSDGRAYRVNARFGVSGNLPLVVVSYPDAFFVVDGVTGLVSEPYEPRTTIDPVPLLAMHAEFEIGSPVLVQVASGCGGGGPVAAIWNPAPPTCPRCPAPAPVWVPVPAPAGSPPGTPPGRYSPTGCVTKGAGLAAARCECTWSGFHHIPPPVPVQYPTSQPTVVPVRVTCTTPGACSGLAQPGTPPAGCTTQYWY